LKALGDVPTKVRKTPRDLAQTRIFTTTHGFLRLFAAPKIRWSSGRLFWGLDPDLAGAADVPNYYHDDPLFMFFEN
jgi:hypothetical protein